jgi:tetratricopeptide (TPR) repeat protein
VAACFRKLPNLTEAARSSRAQGLRLTALRCLLGVLFLEIPRLPAQVFNQTSELEAARGAERAGRYEEAATLYRRFLAGGSSSEAERGLRAQVRTRLATAYFLLHRYRDSLEAVGPLTRSGDAVPAQAWLVEGLDHLQLNQPPEAIPPLRRALALDPGSGTARLALGDALVRSGRLEEGAREYEEQTRRTPALPDAWYKLGLAYAQRSGDLAQKVPESIVGQQLSAEELLAKGDDLGAAGALFRLLRQAPSQPQVRAELGTALLEMGYPKAAEDRFREELSQDPDCPLARLGLAETAALRGDWEQALSSVEALARSHPHELARLLELPPTGLLREAWIGGKIHLPERFAGSGGGKLWARWLSNADSPMISAGLEASHSCSSPPSKALVTLGLWLPEPCYQRLRDRLRARKAMTLEERIKLAEAEFRLAHYQAARLEAQRVLESDPRNAWGVYWLSQSNGELAQDCFSRVTSLNPESARVHEMLGQYYSVHHNFPRAKTEYLAALQLAPDLPDLHLGLGTVYLYGGEWSEAERELEKTLELTPGSALARYELGDAYVQQRRWQPALEHLRRALDDPALAVKARLDLATAEAEMGQTRQAVSELLPVAQNDQDGQIHYRLAGLYRKLGEKDRAREALAAFKRIQSASLQADRSELEALERERERGDSDTLKLSQ